MKQKAINLTPDLYRELDIITRTRCGSVIEIVPAEEMGGDFARISLWAQTAYPNSTSERPEYTGTITLANQITVDSFWNCPRYEMDWSKVPSNRIYHFITYHEVGHQLNDYNFWKAHLKFYYDNEGERKFLIANEIRADRFAWRAIFPKKPLPVKKEHRAKVVGIEKFMGKYAELFPSEPRKIPALSTSPHEWIPWRHKKH
jgi:hypothetical protein